MSNFGSAFGASALGGLFGNINSFNRSTYRSGWGNFIDPVGGLLGYALIMDDEYQDERSREMMGYQAQLNSALMAQQYGYQIRGLQEGPSAYKQGLISAGYNPMLAVNGAMPSVSVSSQSVGSQSPKDSPRSSSVDISSSWEQSQRRQLIAAQTSIAKAEASSARSQASLEKEYAEMELEALRDEDYKVLVDGKDSNPTRSDYRQMIRNGIQRQRFTNSREHAIAEDTVNAIHGGTSAFQLFESGRFYRKKSK